MAAFSWNWTSDTQDLVRYRLFNWSVKNADKGGDAPCGASKGGGHKHGANLEVGSRRPMGEPAPDPKQVVATPAIGVVFLDSRIKHNSAATKGCRKVRQVG
jgi:hypothetical protein